jgi:hypothetical protein
MPIIIFDCKGVPATRRERTKPPSKLAAGMFGSPTKRGSRLIHFAEDCGCWSLAHGDSSGRSFSTWMKTRQLLPSGSERPLTNERYFASEWVWYAAPRAMSRRFNSSMYGCAICWIVPVGLPAAVSVSLTFCANRYCR